MTTINQTETKYFPVIGAQGVDKEAAQAYEGRWRVLDDTGRVLGTEEPALAEITVALQFGYLVLRAPGMLRLGVPLDVVEDDPSVLETVRIDGVETTVADEGNWAREWITNVLGRPARLVKVCD